MTGRPLSEAPRDGTVILVEIMRHSGVPETGGYRFERMVAAKDSADWWNPVGQPNSHYSASSILRWFPGDTDPATLTLTERTNWNFRPSNGTEGEDVYDSWCANCIRERPIREDYDHACAMGLGCDIYLRTMAFDIGHPSYPTEWTYKPDGEPKCTAFEKDVGEPKQEPRCTQTIRNVRPTSGCGRFTRGDIKMLKPSYVKLIAAACAVALLASPAFAQGKGGAGDPAPGGGGIACPSKDCPISNTLTYPASGGGVPDGLTVEQALNVTAGLDQLGSYDTVDKDGKATKVFYKFSGDVRILIAVNLDIGRAVQSRFQAARNAIVMQVSEGSGRVSDEKTPALTIEVEKLMKAPSRAGFARIKMADLKLEENPIPAPVLSLIIPILDR